MVIFLAAGWAIQARPQFDASEIDAPGSDLMLGDLDGDGLKDLIVIDDFTLSIFYQDAKQGYARAPQQTYELEHRPCIVWVAKLGGPAESLLVMTADGVSELCFTNRTGPPLVRQIIHQPTIIPDVVEQTNAVQLALSAGTTGGWPLLLVPVTDGLQVWQHQDQWRRVQVIHRASDAKLWPLAAGSGYASLLTFNFSVADVNGDGRDDLMLRSSPDGWTNFYDLYLQQTNGQFTSDPVMTYADQADLGNSFSWLGWFDLNRDGRVDLVKGVWLNEPSFLPGIPAGKVLVSTYLADGQGRIPTEPQQVFRKNDWMSMVPVLDVDGDGYPDLVLGYHHLDSKESLDKEITARRIDYTLKFYFYRPGTGYPREADCRQDVAIHLDHAESPVDWDLAEMIQRFVKVGGDFGGDGKTDLLVHDHADGISAYFFVSREKGFDLEPDLKFDCREAVGDWQVADLNHDGVSDLIVKLADRNGYRIFLSRK